jgi:hypothetical protein
MSKPASRLHTETRRAFLAEQTYAILALAKNVVRDVVEIGRRLSETKTKFSRGENPEFLAWAQNGLGWSEGSVYTFMQVFDFASKGDFSKFEKLDLTSIYLLARYRNTLPEVIEAVAERSAEGERPSRDEVKTMVAEAKAHTITYKRIEQPPPVVRTITYERIEQPAPVSRTVTPYTGSTTNLRTLSAQVAGREIMRGVVVIDYTLARYSAGEVIATLTDDERQRVRDLIDRLKAALDARSNIVEFPGSNDVRN